MNAMQKGRRWTSWSVTICVWLAIGLILRSGLTLRNPPAGDLVYEKGSRRVYVLHQTSSEQEKQVVSWAERYSGSVLNDVDFGQPACTSVFSGNVAVIEVGRGPKSVLLYGDHTANLRNGDMVIWVHEHPLSTEAVLTRAKVALFARS